MVLPGRTWGTQQTLHGIHEMIRRGRKMDPMEEFADLARDELEKLESL
jgi:hypothetical protein